MLGSDLPMGQQFGTVLFANQLAALLEQGERRVLDELQPVITQLMAELDALVAQPEPLSPEALYNELDRLTAPLNNEMEQLLGAAMVQLQGPLREQAARLATVRTPAPAASPQDLMARALVGGEAIADHLRRRSPSRWQAELMGAIRSGIEAGWERHRRAVEENINRLAEVMASTAMWAHGNKELELAWETPSRWRYVGVLDPSTCPICSPWIDRTSTMRIALPQTPQHWSCRCHVIPD